MGVVVPRLATPSTRARRQSRRVRVLRVVRRLVRPTPDRRLPRAACDKPQADAEHRRCEQNRSPPHLSHLPRFPQFPGICRHMVRFFETPVKGRLRWHRIVVPEDGTSTTRKVWSRPSIEGLKTAPKREPPEPSKQRICWSPYHPRTREASRRASRTRKPAFWTGFRSGRRDSNSGPLVPQTSALTRLRHAPPPGHRSGHPARSWAVRRSRRAVVSPQTRRRSL